MFREHATVEKVRRVGEELAVVITIVIPRHPIPVLSALDEEVQVMERIAAVGVQLGVASHHLLLELGECRRSCSHGGRGHASNMLPRLSLRVPIPDSPVDALSFVETSTVSEKNHVVEKGIETRSI
jgi:hypothetical protein